MSFLSARGLCISIGGKEVCRDLDLDIRAGEAWAILGINGAGKTTLLHTLAGLRVPDAGEVLLRGTSLHTLRRKKVAQQVGLMLQDTDVVFPLTVRQAALEGRHPFLHRFHWERPEDEAIADRVLEELGIGHLADRPLQTLSGGEKRLVAAATLFVQDPAVLMLDEPNSHLDLYQQLRVLERVLSRVRSRGRAALLIVHDVNLAARFCDRVVLLNPDASVVHGPLTEVLDERAIERAFRHRVTRLVGPLGPHFVPL